MEGFTFRTVGATVVHDWAELAATILWLVLLTDAINLIDGLYGLATCISLFGALTMVASALSEGNVPLAMASVPLAAASL